MYTGMGAQRLVDYTECAVLCGFGGLAAVDGLG